MSKNIVKIDTSSSSYDTDLEINGEKIPIGICGVRIELLPSVSPKIFFDKETKYKCWSKMENCTTIKDCWFACPYCGKKLFKVRSTSYVADIAIYCRGCKKELNVNMDQRAVSQ